MLDGIAAQQARLREERHVRRAAFGQPGTEEGRDAVAGRCVAHRHTGLAGKRTQHKLEIPLLDA